MAERTYRWLFWVLAVGGTVLDQVGKYGVFHWLPQVGAARPGRAGVCYEWPARHGFFWLETNFTDSADAGGWLSALRTWGVDRHPYLNHGALFGLGNGHNGLFSLVSVAAAVAIVYWTTRRAAARDWTLCASLGLILAGTLGNLYDRVVFDGVRDFLHFEVQGVIDWPIFNLADSFLVCGAALLVLQAFWARTPAEAGGPARPAEMAEAPKA
jgi:lipoprotein signal peptidase